MTLRILGIDPGAHTGLILVELEEGWDLLNGRFLRAETVNAPTKGKHDDTWVDRRFMQAIETLVVAWRPDLVVMEDPSDGVGYWGGKVRTKRETSYRLGCYKALVFAVLPIDLPVFQYRVKGKKADIGWMTEHPNREMAIYRSKVLAGTIGCGLPDALSEHCLMALGVIAFHCRKMALEQRRSA